MSPAVPQPAPRHREPSSRRDQGPDLAVVVPRTRHHGGVIGAITILVIFGALFVNAVFHTVLVSGQRRLDDLSGQVEDAQHRNQRLRLHVATLESPTRIVERAQRNGMVVPDETHWLSPPADAGTAPSEPTDAGTAPDGAGAGTDERAAPSPSTGPTTPTRP